MSVTIKKIAELSGVSRGTVDRVLNNRGKVRPEIDGLVRSIAEQLGYRPNIAGKALAARKKSLLIGIVMASEGNAFFEDVLRGIYEAEKELKDYGVKIVIKTMKGYHVEEQLAYMDFFRTKANAVILNAINDTRIADKINELTENGVCVVTVNTDIENSNRLCYVGSNYEKGGETACGMLGFLTGGKANVGILTGSTQILGHNQRVDGFRSVIEKKYSDIKICDFAQTNDDDILAYDVCKEMLSNHTEIDALFVVAAGIYGVCRAVIAMGLSEKMNIICFDKIPSTVEMMEKGLIKATICQQPYTQGNKSVHIAFDYLISGIKPDKQQYIMKNEIKIPENL